MTNTPHTDLHGKRVLAHLTDGTTTIDGTLQPSEHGLMRVTLSTGADILLRPDHVRAINPYEEAPRDEGGRHQLAQYQDLITDAHWLNAKAVHEAAHAVTAIAMGITVTGAHVATSRTDPVGGEVNLQDNVDVQALAVFYVAGPLAHGRRIKELGYDGLTQAAVETLAGQGDEKKITDHLHRGYVSWRSQAQRDAEAILGSRRVWKATLDLGEELAARGRMTGEEIAKVVGSKKLTDHQVWLP